MRQRRDERVEMGERRPNGPEVKGAVRIRGRLLRDRERPLGLPKIRHGRLDHLVGPGFRDRLPLGIHDGEGNTKSDTSTGQERGD